MKPITDSGPSRLQKSVEIGTLCAFYGCLLTPRQRDALRLHYEEDLSLGEIAGELGVSRQNVHELIVRSADKLRRYEASLGGVRRASETAQGLRQVLELLAQTQGRTQEDKSRLEEAAALIGRLLRQQEGE